MYVDNASLKALVYIHKIPFLSPFSSSLSPSPLRFEKETLKCIMEIHDPCLQEKKNIIKVLNWKHRNSLTNLYDMRGFLAASPNCLFWTAVLHSCQVTVFLYYFSSFSEHLVGWKCCRYDLRYLKILLFICILCCLITGR